MARIDPTLLAEASAHYLRAADYYVRHARSLATGRQQRDVEGGDVVPLTAGEEESREQHGECDGDRPPLHTGAPQPEPSGDRGDDEEGRQDGDLEEEVVGRAIVA